METALGQPLPEESRGTSLDGKTLCNTLAAHERNVHLLSLLDQALGCVLSQQAVDPSTNEAKAALDLLKTVVLKGALGHRRRDVLPARDLPGRLSIAAAITCSSSKTTSPN